MRRLAVLASAAFALLAAACGGGGSSAVTPPPTSSQPPASPPVSVTPTPVLGEPIPIPRLPSQGVAVQVGRSVALVTVQGHQVQRLHKFNLVFVTDAPGSVVVFGGNSYYKLDVKKNQLTPISAADAKALRSKGGGANLASPPGSTTVPGRYVWARQSPRSSTLLASYVATCGRSFALLGSPGSTPALISGSPNSIDTGPSSQALGWTTDGHSVALVYDGGCGSAISSSDLVVYTSAGSGSTIFHTGGAAAARMWGSA